MNAQRMVTIWLRYLQEKASWLTQSECRAGVGMEDNCSETTKSTERMWEKSLPVSGPQILYLQNKLD